MTPPPPTEALIPDGPAIAMLIGAALRDIATGVPRTETLLELRAIAGGRNELLRSAAEHWEARAAAWVASPERMTATADLLQAAAQD